MKERKELLKKLNEEIEIKNNAWSEKERFEREIARLQELVKETDYIIKMQNKVLDKISEDLRKLGGE